MTREQIGQALEYSQPRVAITKIHKQYSDRLEHFSVVTKLVSTDGKAYDTRVYSARGVYEICRWSRQPKADAFMDFCWEVVERLLVGDMPMPEPDMRTLVTDITRSVVTEVVQQLLPVIAQLAAPYNTSSPEVSTLPPSVQLSVNYNGGHPNHRLPNRKRSKIDMIPANIRAAVDVMFAQGETYDKMRAFLKNMGYSISNGAICNQYRGATIAQRKTR